MISKDLHQQSWQGMTSKIVKFSNSLYELAKSAATKDEQKDDTQSEGSEIKKFPNYRAAIAAKACCHGVQPVGSRGHTCEIQSEFYFIAGNSSKLIRIFSL